MPADEPVPGIAAPPPDGGPAPLPPDDCRAPSPGRLLFVLAGTLVVAEVGVMAALDRAGLAQSSLGALLDAVALLALVGPVLYLTAYRPLRRLVAESRRAAQRARASEERYRSLFENSLDPVFLTTPGGRILETNPAAREVFGYSEEEFRQMGRDGLVDTADPRLAPALEERRGTGRFRGQLTLRHADGHPIPAEVASHVYRDSVGVLRTCTVVRDVSATVAAAEALAESEERYRLLLEKSGIGVGYYAPDGTVLFFNEKALEHLGGRNEDYVGRTAVDVFGLDLGQTIRTRLARAARSETEQVYEDRLELPSGEKWFFSIFSRVVDAEGDVRGVQIVSHDITERRRAEEVLQKSEALFRELWEQMSSGVAVYEPAPDGEDFLVVDLNRTGERTARVDRREVRGTRLLDAFPGARDLGLWDLLWQVLRTGEPGRLPAARYEDAHHAYWVENYVYRLPTGQVVAVFDDVTARHEAEEALRRHADEIRRLGARLRELETEERRRLAAELHDQVGQNLSALDIDLELLDADLCPACREASRHRVDDCRRLLDEIGDRVRDVMGALRPQALEDFGLRAALRWQCGVFSARHGIPCTVTGEAFVPRLPAEVEMALFRVAQEALANAAKHARASRLDLRLEEDAGVCRVIVADDGQGFSAAGGEREGTRRGWGISLMKERAESVGGTLRVESGPGEGTRVIVEVPR